MKVALSCLLAAFCWIAGVAHAQAPVVFVLAAGGNVVVTNATGQQYKALPTQNLLQGHLVDVPKGQRFSVLVLKTGNRRVFVGPASLKVIADTIRLQKGSLPKVIPLTRAELGLIAQWTALYSKSPDSNISKTQAPDQDPTLLAKQPIDGSLLLTRNPQFVFEGSLPREGNLMIFDSRGKRFWVEPLESEYVSFPPAAKFEWGQSFTWEVRRLTGGRVVSGSFQIASEQTARSLLEARVPDLPSTLPESQLFYGMRLQMAGAFKEANEVWNSLGMRMAPDGRAHRLN